MKRTTRLVAGATSALVLAGTATVLSSSAALAAGSLGFISVSPTTGPATSRPSFTTAADCPAGTAYYNALLNGPAGSGWSDTTVLGATDYAPGGGSFSTQLADTFAGLAAANAANFTTPGNYLVTFQCLDATSSPNGTSGVAKLVFNSAGTTYTAVDAPATATALTATPASSTTGQAVDLTATVTSATAGLAGAVQFSYGVSDTALGAPVALAGGTATTSVSTLPVGVNTVKATFVPDNTSTPTHEFQGSSGTATATVTAPSSTTTLSINPAGPKYTSTPITLAASVLGNATNGTPTGSVVFTYTLPGAASATTSSPVAVAADGSAALPLGTLSQGTLTALCSFTPAAGSPYTGSSSAQESAPIQGQDPNTVGTEIITTTVNAGALTLAVQGFTAPSPTTATGTPVGSPTYPYTPGATPTNVVVLPAANVNNEGTFIVTSGNVIPVVVTDTRAGDFGYNVTGQLSDFTGQTASNKINAANLGWTPSFISYNRFASATSAAAAGLGDGGVALPADGLQPNVTAASGQPDGLASAKTLYTAPASTGTGTVTYGANVALKAPTTTAADTYTATLTLTANATP